MDDIVTDRIILRQWQTQDLKPLIAMNACPQVMRYFGSTRTPQQSESLLEYCSHSIGTKGWGFWAAELRSNNEFIGFIGLNSPDYDLPFSPCVEIGWRLAKHHWGNGYATEGARASLAFAFEQTEIDEIVSMTPCQNLASEAVMRKIGMTDMGQNFDHPDVPLGHELAEHFLYKITRAEWLESANIKSHI